MADQDVDRIALEDFGDGGRPDLHVLGSDADLTPDEHVGQGRGVAGELGRRRGRSCGEAERPGPSSSSPQPEMDLGR